MDKPLSRIWIDNDFSICFELLPSRGSRNLFLYPQGLFLIYFWLAQSRRVVLGFSRCVPRVCLHFSFIRGLPSAGSRILICVTQGLLSIDFHSRAPLGWFSLCDSIDFDWRTPLGWFSVLPLCHPGFVSIDFHSRTPLGWFSVDIHPGFSGMRWCSFLYFVIHTIFNFYIGKIKNDPGEKWEIKNTNFQLETVCSEKVGDACHRTRS